MKSIILRGKIQGYAVSFILFYITCLFMFFVIQISYASMGTNQRTCWAIKFVYKILVKSLDSNLEWVWIVKDQNPMGGLTQHKHIDRQHSDTWRKLKPQGLLFPEPSIILIWKTITLSNLKKYTWGIFFHNYIQYLFIALKIYI